MAKKTSRIVVPPGGAARFVHDDVTTAMMGKLGNVSIRRASHVDQYLDLSDKAKLEVRHMLKQQPPYPGWFADLSPSGGPVLGPFNTHSEAIKAELTWLFENNIPHPDKE